MRPPSGAGRRETGPVHRLATGAAGLNLEDSDPRTGAPRLLADPTVLSRFVAAVGGPVNALLRPGAPPVAELARLGVARISLGSGVYATTRARAGAMLAALRHGADPFAG